MDPFMLTSVALLAREAGWRQPERSATPSRLVRARRRVAATLRATAVLVEPAPACEPMRPLAAR